jgi:CRISPR-associated endonuclease/helicase Cas3
VGTNGRASTSVDARLWGKHQELTAAYPVICHLIDAAATAWELWGIWFGKNNKTDLAHWRRNVSFWAGLHDIGKISPSFQVKVRPLLEKLIEQSPEYGEDEPVPSLGHHEVTHWVLVQILREFGYKAGSSARRDVGHQIAQMLGGHHGRFCAAIPRNEWEQPRRRKGIGSGKWEEQCRNHAEVLRRLTGANEPVDEHLPPALLAIALGVIVVADWLVSQKTFIEPRLPGEGWSATDAELQAHWERALADAPRLIADAGLGAAGFRDLPFSDLFGFEPNNLQRSLIEELPALVDGPGMLLITAPPGDGKTEAALYSAGVLARAGHATGLGFCLPTMATTDAMHKRMQTYVSRAFTGDPSLTKVHSMAWLSRDSSADSAESAEGAPEVLSDRKASAEATQWLHAGKRGLLAPLSTLTIDQALTGVLPVRFNMLRLMALSGKVLVIDEAHSYDAWMHALLLRFLEWMGAMGAPVVVLSATLTGTTARSLVEAYLGGCGHSLAEDFEPTYPGWLFASATSGAISEPIQVRSERERAVEFPVRAVRRGDDTSHPEHRLSVIKELLQPLVHGPSGCALICCTTVEEAQQTHEALGSWFAHLESAGHEVPRLRLLHSRFRAKDRAAITAACERDFGKEGTRPSTVLVATQIVEQSLDLDFDLIISDLAPLAFLLQRSGRCRRHQNPDGDPHQARRPHWLSPAPRVVVLDPVDEEGRFAVPENWGDVYSKSLLERTSILLRARAGGRIAIPSDVQSLVNEVYSEDFAAVHQLGEREALQLGRRDGERLATDAAHRQTAERLVAIQGPSPRKLRDLSVLTTPMDGVDDDLIATRLGADSARLVCVYEQSSGHWTLDEEGELPVPGLNGEARVTREDARTIALHMLPVPARWLGRGADLLDLPPSWSRNSVLAKWTLLPMRRARSGEWLGRLQPGTVRYRPNAGITIPKT